MRAVLKDKHAVMMCQYFTPRTNTNTNRYSYSLASCSVCEANTRRRTNIISKTLGKYWSVVRTPSQKHGASIRPPTHIPSKTWASIRTRTNTLCKTLGQVFVGRIPVPSQKHWASSRPWTSNTPLPKRGANTHNKYLCFNIEVQLQIVMQQRTPCTCIYNK